MVQLDGGRSRLLTVGELSQRSGVAISALHYYERQQLLTSERTAGNQRRYRREALRRIAFIRVSQRVGVPLARIAEALATLPDGRPPTKRDWARLSNVWRDELDARIADLQHLRNDLTSCIGCGCLSLRTCSLQNPEDSRGARGDGPTIWTDQTITPPDPDPGNSLIDDPSRP
ncbi:redox-sensitive transcriptional activator SoxR [Plantibacter sp. RU18]|uniref:redox-sensitive transcriptional activator SoxR n=1 Tax=Plantibacter sp. RU18 TaxID=3158143 RepID=UPI003D36DCA8